ncbi:Hypothetical predicted protein [Cloeon dipterum]|uniref:Nucleolus and neural progenitor protein-like N-terminal domain-containing protein n=2 Tax=Cloeon dipterum TaxID=197152 RepID=A0A8S1CJF4_9INSE|nr:Hypothetical predicted protein [Cloeon dipterum]
MERILDNLDAKAPATSTIKCNLSAAVVRDLKSKCEELRKLITLNKVFKVEVSLVEKLIYRNSNRLRLDLGFRFFRNIKRFSTKLELLNLELVLDNFFSCLPESTFGSSFYLPSCQMLQHLLHQLTAFVVILEKMVFYSEKSGLHFIERIKSGHSWSTASVFLGAASRVNHVCSRLSWKCCKQYNGLATALDFLKLSGPNWTPDGFQFPKSLEEALCVENPFKMKGKISTESSKIFNLVGNNTEIDEDNDDIIQFYDTTSQSKQTRDACETSEDVKPIIDFTEDKGEIVPRHEEIVVFDQVKKKKKKRNQCDPKQVEVVDVEDETVPKKKPRKEANTENKMTGTMEEMIDRINSCSSLANFIKVISDANNESYSSARRQVAGILKMLKKKPNEVASINLLTRARNVLKSVLL